MKRRSFITLVIAGGAGCTMGLKKSLKLKTVLLIDHISMLEYNKHSDLPLGTKEIPLIKEQIPVTVKKVRLQDLRKGDWLYISTNKDFNLFEGPHKALGNPFPLTPEGNWGINIA